MEIFSNLPHDNSILEKSNVEQGRCFSLRCLEIAYHTIVYIHISQGCENGLYGAGDGRNGFIIFLACISSLPYAPRDQWESARLKQHHNTRSVCVTFCAVTVNTCQRLGIHTISLLLLLSSQLELRHNHLHLFQHDNSHQNKTNSSKCLWLENSTTIVQKDRVLILFLTINQIILSLIPPLSINQGLLTVLAYPVALDMLTALAHLTALDLSMPPM